MSQKSYNIIDFDENSINRYLLYTQGVFIVRIITIGLNGSIFISLGSLSVCLRFYGGSTYRFAVFSSVGDGYASEQNCRG